MLKLFPQSLLALFYLAVLASAQTPIPPPRISVPDINGRAITLVKPAFPETAIVVGADGSTVPVKVVVNGNGDVISATCAVTCHPLLKDAAEYAALTSKFRPLMRDGVAIEYEGTLLYNYVVKRVDWFAFGSALESVRWFDNISFGPVAQILSADFEEEKKLLLSGNEPDTTFEARQQIIADTKAAIRAKLEKEHLWQFELAMALRRVTFWANVGYVDREKMQRALVELEPHITSAPEDTPPQMLEALDKLTKFKIPDDISDRDLMRAILEITRNMRQR